MLFPNPGPIRMTPLDLAVGTEFVAAFLFAMLAGVTYDALTIAAAFAATMFFAAFASGAHINPAVSLASGLSGHAQWTRVLFYIIAQVLGTLAGTALLLYMVPGLHAGDAKAAACHGPVRDLGGTGLYLWETLLTFVFTYVLYGAIMHPPGHGAVAPLTAGVTLFACLSAGGRFTGLSPLNPAITFASTLIFDCYWGYSWMYWLAQVTGAGLAALLAVYAFGRGPYLLDEDQRRDYYASYAGRQQGAAYEPLLGSGERAPHGQGTTMMSGSHGAA